MNIYFVSSNLYSNNLVYKDSFSIENKMRLRTLSLEGVELIKILSFKDVSRVFSSTDIYCVEGAKYYALNNNLDILLTEELNDLKVGELSNKNLKMLSYFQEKDFHFKNKGGESLYECASRVERVISYIKTTNESSIVFIPRRTLFSFLLKYTKQGFNLEERMVLLYNDKVIMENIEEDIEIIKMSFEDNTYNIERIEV